MSAATSTSDGFLNSRLKRLFFVFLGIIIGQFVLHGPSLVGRKVLLPLDILAAPGIYLPQTPAVTNITTGDPALADLVTIAEMSRWFAASEIQQGRWPMWAPYEYAGVPVTSPRYSPFFLLTCLTRSPVILAWKEMLIALVAGLGFYVFCRRVLRLGFWPSTITAWCYPITAFFVFWTGLSLGPPVVWLPWFFTAIDRAVRHRARFALLEVSTLTGVVLVCGALDVAGQVLLVSGLFAVWTLINVGLTRATRKQLVSATATLVLAWTLGFGLAAPYLLPLMEYSHTGARMQKRSSGDEERPPIGIASLPQVVFPEMYGSTVSDSVPNFPANEVNLQESSAATYVGVLTTLFLMPLAWASRRHRAMNTFLVLLAVLALGWCLNLPGVVQLLRMPGLNMMSHNRLVFAASFAILAMSAIGLELLFESPPQRRGWFWAFAVIPLSLSGWALFRSLFLPEPIATNLGAAILEGQQVFGIHTLEGVQRVHDWYIRVYTTAFVFFSLAVAAWLLLLFWKNWHRSAKIIIAGFVLIDLLWFGVGKNPQCDTALYYPRIGALEQIAKSVPGRVVAFNCLPAPLTESHGLMDMRGYDAVDPTRFVELVAPAEVSDAPIVPYARTQHFLPRVAFVPPHQLRVSPILDMLGVRYLIIRRPPVPPYEAAFHSDDYWVMLNENALPRAFVPRRVETVINSAQRLERLSASNFNAREVAFVEDDVSVTNECSGSVDITSEIPTQIKLRATMDTPGLVVLADLWDVGWKAYVDGKSVPILRTNHAIRGVVVPAGVSMIEFRYEPDSFRRGLLLFTAACVVVAGWTMWVWYRHGRHR